MGQMTVGILFGVRAPEGVELFSDSLERGANEGLLDRWSRECEALIDAHRAMVNAKVRATPGVMPYHFEGAHDRYVPDAMHDNDPYLIGFWICAGASGKDGLPHMENLAMPTSKVRTVEPYAKAYRNAKRRWSRFAKWARAQGVDLPKPRLWRAETEVA